MMGHDAVAFGAGFELPRHSGVPQVQRVVEHRVGHPAVRDDREALWDAAFFGLDRSELFHALPPKERDEVLRKLSFGLLEEALFVERAGMAFDAKMVLLAESCEERMLYAHFGAEEASHFAAVEALMGHEVSRAKPTMFHRWLARGLHIGDRATLILVMQVVMEGWGMDHYRRMAHGTRDGAAREVFRSILRDEAGHHGSGVASFQACEFNASSLECSVDLLHELLGMVRAGPVAVVEALRSARGGLSAAEETQLYVELGADAQVRERVGRLGQLILGAGAGEEAKRVFRNALALEGPS